jgi:hypothetical protein
MNATFWITEMTMVKFVLSLTWLQLKRAPRIHRWKTLKLRKPAWD